MVTCDEGEDTQAEAGKAQDGAAIYSAQHN